MLDWQLCQICYHLEINGYIIIIIIIIIIKTDIVAPPLVLHSTYDNYLSAVVKFL